MSPITKRSGSPMYAARIPLLVVLCACFMTGCGDRKPISEMSDEEKVAMEVSGERSLSEEERMRQKAAREAVLERASATRECEKKLSQALSSAGEVLSESAKKHLDALQERWSHYDRGVDINLLVRKGVPAAEAYTRAICERASWIEQRVSWQMLIEMPGEVGGFYRGGDERTLEVYEMPDGLLNAVIRTEGDSFVYTASGHWDGREGNLASERDSRAGILLLKAGEDSIEVYKGAHFGESIHGAFGALVEGRYERVSPGGIDVFEI